MAEYISRDAAICIADYAVDEHPYDKNPEKPETYSDYNQGWNDACDYIRERLENAEKADVAPVRRQSCKFCNGAGYTEEEFTVTTQLGRTVRTQFNFCPNCGADMRGADGEN